MGNLLRATTDVVGNDGVLDTHTLDEANPHVVTKDQVALGNVDNTSDVNKPVSTATQTALNLKADNTSLTTLTDNVLQRDNLDVYAPVSPYHPATKAYVDSQVSTGGGNVAVTKTEEFLSNGTASEVYTTSSGYIIGSITITLNGTELAASDFTAGDGSTFTLTQDAVAGDVVRITIYGGADVYNKTQSDARYEPLNTDLLVNTDNQALADTNALTLSGSDVSLNKGDGSSDTVSLIHLDRPTPIAMSTVLAGELSLSNTIKTLGFDAITYTGNGTSQDIVTGLSTIDFTVAGNGTGFYHDRVAGGCIVKNDAGDIIESGSIAFKDVTGVDGVCKVHIKKRGIGTQSHSVIDGLRGRLNRIATDSTATENTRASLLQFSNAGITLENENFVNESGETYVAYIELYTHIKWGLTNQGKRYIEAYNPVTNDTMIMYQGSGVAGHEIPHSVGVKLDLVSTKKLDTSGEWRINYDDMNNFNYTSAAYTDTRPFKLYDTYGVPYNDVDSNGLNSSYILYGKAKSKTWTIVQYIGIGAAGNFVETLDVDGVARRPARVIIKRTNTDGGWLIYDNKRDNSGTNDLYIRYEANTAESPHTLGTFELNGITIDSTDPELNGISQQYIALVEFDTDGTGTDGSYFDNPSNTTQLQLTDGLFSISNGYDLNGSTNKIVSKTGTITPTGGWN